MLNLSKGLDAEKTEVVQKFARTGKKGRASKREIRRPGNAAGMAKGLLQSIATTEESQ